MKTQQGKEQDYLDYTKLNAEDAYSNEVVMFSERWADLMEVELAAGKNLEDIADEAGSKADINGITGFMYGCAVRGLSTFWVHGELLRKWHNKQYLGDDHKDTGGVVNPAIITINT